MIRLIEMIANCYKNIDFLIIFHSNDKQLSEVLKKLLDNVDVILKIFRICALNDSNIISLI